MDDIAIKFENISKQYRLGLVSTKTLSHDLNRWWQTSVLRKEDPYLRIGETNDRSTKGESEYVWALRDINFEVKKGEVLGIIGKNGAGKSTLLKILSRVTTPTTGIIKAQGRIASLLEVGTGFHPESTGRENIYMNGSIMGMTRKEIDSKLDEIVEFAGVARYVDTPVKRYSSGMTVRLGFSIAAHLEPEILVVDEVLAVGDAEFQKKAIGKMQDVSQGDGRTVLFVSHNMGSMATLCDTGIILEKGRLVYSGLIKDAINTYISNSAKESSYECHFSNKDLYFKNIYFRNSIDKKPSKVFPYDKPFNICFELNHKRNIPQDTVLSFTIFDIQKRPLFSSHKVLHNKINDIVVQVPAHLLLGGGYYLRPVLHIPNICFLDKIPEDIYFEIEDTGSIHSLYKNADLGFINVNLVWNETDEKMD
ncbi:ABC transporter ATP-binding protein [Bacteroidia bacterium]|nr:ABC transporter ATP-binding protein [Bacteroidia bacterium]GHT48121.1 ABC transporter ATP-binding protein [Bacteroidia bacterium]